MIFKRVFFMILFFVLTLTGPVMAAKRVSISSAFGQVDLALVLIFHPSMDYYYPREGLFTYEFEKSLSKEEVSKKFEKLLSQRKKGIDEAVVKIKKMQNSISSFIEQKNRKKSKCQQNINILRNEMAAKLNRATSQTQRQKIENEYKIKIEKEEETYSSFSRQIENKLDSIGRMYDFEKSRVQNITYADADKQNSFIEEIVKEIESAVTEAAKESKTSVVFNGQILRAQNKKIKTKRTQAWKDIFQDSPFQRFGNSSLNAAGHFLPDDVKYSSRLAQYSQYSKKFKNQPLFNSVFLVGGTDLTPNVIRIVHERNGYSEKQINKILKVYFRMTSGNKK